MEEIDRNTDNNNPLVSIVVITYNSAKYVLETLESAKAQTYQNIELIVSDDCSTDNTVEICRNWIDENKDRFVRTELITVEKNTGIAPNCNRGLYKAEGEWVKFIAGDDVLESKGIEYLVDYIRLNPDYMMIYGKMKIIDDSSNYIGEIKRKKYLYGYIFKDVIYGRHTINTPTVIFNKSVLLKVGAFNEELQIEDSYIFLKISEKYRIGFVDKFICNYRRHQTNVSRNYEYIYKYSKLIIEEYKNSIYYKKAIRYYKFYWFVILAKCNKNEARKYLLTAMSFCYTKRFWLSFYYLIKR